MCRKKSRPPEKSGPLHKFWLYMGQVESLATESDNLNHSKYAVWSFLRVIAESLKKKYPKVLRLKIFSDNAASQFRSKFMISNLCYLDEDLGFSFVE